MLNPRQRFDIVKDPVHGYIRFTRDKLVRDEKATEADLINSPWLQRLRRIHQLQTAWYVYPMADHARFSHSLGAMELAGRFARAVYAPFYAFHRGSLNGEPLPETEHVVETFRIAGLLHDVGHGPLTHLLDRQYLKPRFDITHEDLAGKIIEDELRELVAGIRRSPDGPFEEPLDIEVIRNLIKKGAEERLHGIWRPLHQIIRGAFDADKMDFLLRDGLLCGEQKITMWDVERLTITSFLSEDGTGFQLHYSSLPLLLSFIKFRQHMLEVVYYHRTVRAFELMIEDTVPVLLEKLMPDDPREHLADYLKLDEYEFFTQVREQSRLSRTIGDVWEKAWQRGLDWKQVEEGKKQLLALRMFDPSLRPKSCPTE
jgi:HD superfamily phosphohydrolase